MSNNFYNHGSFPTTGSAATSASMRSELDSIAAGFDKMPTLTGNANDIVVVNSSGTALDSIPTLPATSGGTGLASYAVGDLLYASTTTALSRLADIATGNALISGGVGVAPSWGKVGLTTHVSGVLPTANGGTNLSVFTANRIFYASSTSVMAQSANLTFDGTTLTAANFADSSLTSTRVVYAGASGNLTDSSNLTFDGTTLTAAGFSGPLNGTVGAGTPNSGSFTTLTTSSTVTVNGGTANQVQYLNASKVLVGSSNMTFDGTTLTVADIADASLTSGRVVFAGTGGNLNDSSNLTWNGSTLAITGALTATTDSAFTSTGALQISKGTTGEQPGSPSTGMVRYNTSTNQFEGYSGSSPAWKSIGGSTLNNDTSTATTLYPVFAGATSGTAENLYTSNAKLLYTPSIGDLTVTQLSASNGIMFTNQTINTSVTFPTGYDGISGKNSTIASGVTVTVPSGQTWTIV